MSNTEKPILRGSVHQLFRDVLRHNFEVSENESSAVDDANGFKEADFTPYTVNRMSEFETISCCSDRQFFSTLPA